MFYLWSLSREVLYWAWHKIKKPCWFFFFKRMLGRLRWACTHCYIWNGWPESTCCTAHRTLPSATWPPGWGVCVCVCVWLSPCTGHLELTNKKVFKKKRKKGLTRTSLSVQRLGLCASNAGDGVQSLVRKLRSHPTSSMAKTVFKRE